MAAITEFTAGGATNLCGGLIEGLRWMHASANNENSNNNNNTTFVNSLLLFTDGNFYAIEGVYKQGVPTSGTKLLKRRMTSAHPGCHQGAKSSWMLGRHPVGHPITIWPLGITNPPVFFSFHKYKSSSTPLWTTQADFDCQLLKST